MALGVIAGNRPMAAEMRRHNVFISHHDADRYYKRRFIQMMGDLIVDVSVDQDDIDDNDLAAETIRQEIRNRHIRQASVTVVLIGPCTWQRMHVDAEIHSSIRQYRLQPKMWTVGNLVTKPPGLSVR